MQPTIRATRPPSRATCHTLLLALLAAGLLAGTTRAADVYVSTNGTQTSPYDSWAKAFTNLQDALDYAGAKVSANIYLAGGQTLTHPAGGAEAESVFLWSGATNVTLSGGWDTGAEPPDTRTTATILRGPGVGGTRRVLRMSSVSNAVVDTVTIRDGYTASSANPNGGAGVHILNCWNVTLANSTITGNGNNPNPQPQRYGGGVFVQGGSVTVTNTLIVSNRCDGAGTGGATGGGIAVGSGGRVTLRRSVISSNVATPTPSGGSAGGFYVGAGSTMELYETVVRANTNSGVQGAGGAGRNDGSVIMQNCLVANNVDQANNCAIYLYAGASTFLNCTIVTNGGYGVFYAGGVFSMTNCIVRGHTAADLLSVPLVNVWYSGIGDGQNNGVQGCTSLDPLFVDTTYYHLKSTINCYTGGYFTGGAWTTAATNSPLIDSGDPSSSYSREPAPNGSRINMGYDGNTELASQSYIPSDRAPAVANAGVTLVGHRSAVLNGLVTDTGYPRAQACFRYWAEGSATTTETARAEQLGTFNATLTSLIPGTTYHYLVLASNRAAQALSDAATFTAHPTPSSLYVSLNGNNSAGTDWTTAYPSVQTALNLAETGDTIYLAGQTFSGGIPGTLPAHPYNAFLVWQNATNIALKGGYNAVTGGGSDPGARSSTTTVKRTVGSVRVLSMISTTNCTIEQMVFRDGYASWPRTDGTGVYLTNSASVAFSGCSIVGNTSINIGGSGIGMYLTRSSVVLSNCTVADNYCNREGSGGMGICVDALSRMTAARSFILRNKGDNAGGNGNVGMGFYNAGVLNLFETVLSGNEALNTANSAVFGGGYNAGTLTMRNCLVVSNRTYAAGVVDGLYLDGGSATIINCTFATNYARGIQYAAGTVAMTNCIVWGHTVADAVNFPAGSIGYSLLAVPNLHGVNGCITNNPLFVSAISNDFRLQVLPIPSPAIDAGLSTLSGWMLSDTDLAGSRRRQHGRLDIGAYESTPSAGTVLLIY